MDGLCGPQNPIFVQMNCASGLGFPKKLRLRNFRVQEGFNQNVAEPAKKRFNAYKTDPYQL